MITARHCMKLLLLLVGCTVVIITAFPSPSLLSRRRNKLLSHYSSQQQDNDPQQHSQQHPPHNNSTNNSCVVTTNTVNNDENALLQRVTQLEKLVSAQAVQLKRLQQECQDLTQVAAAFAQVIEILREAGLETNKREHHDKSQSHNNLTVLDMNDDADIFGRTPRSVLEAADAAGAAILAAILGGHQRLLVDVRDNDLATDQNTLVQFLELAVLPVAAGLEGLRAHRNRLKLVFPTVKQLLQYRKTMALAAPEVVALSTLALDPIESQDNLVVILAPAPDDEQGLQALEQLLAQAIPQPIVVIQTHMVPLTGTASHYEIAYHLRLLSVTFCAVDEDELAPASNHNATTSLEAAVEHARQQGKVQGNTRAMLLRAYPQPWYVFVDSEEDFVVAGTFEREPSSEQVHTAIVECLEGSEQEEEIVAQQMQQALEAGQLDRVSEMLGWDWWDDEEEDDDEDDGGNDMWNVEDSV